MEGEICNFGFLLEPDQTYLGKKPFRTYMGPVYHGGISDHLPVVIRISVSDNKMANRELDIWFGSCNAPQKNGY